MVGEVQEDVVMDGIEKAIGVRRRLDAWGIAETAKALRVSEKAVVR